MQTPIESKQVTQTGLFFIALIPNQDLRKEINAFKLDFSKRFGSSKALKVYPHITLKAPFKCSGTDKRELLNWFTQLNIRQKPFGLNLDGFGALPNRNNPVIFVNPIINNELIGLQKELMTGFNSIFPAYVHPVDVKFKPHVTVAYRDLTPEKFSLAWQEYEHKPFSGVFDVNAIHLLEHDTKKWNLIHTHNLN